MYELSDRKLTYDDYASIDDGKRYELINGELIMAPAPSSSHQRISFRLSNYFFLFIEEHKYGEAFAAPIDVILDETNIVQPDLVYISNPNRNIVKERGIFGVPDLVVEIISPSTITYDRYIKKDIYEKFGVKEFWLADYNNKTIEVFELADGKYELFSFAAEEGIIKSKVIDGFEIDLRKLF